MLQQANTTIGTSYRAYLKCALLLYSSVKANRKKIIWTPTNTLGIDGLCSHHCCLALSGENFNHFVHATSPQYSSTAFVECSFVAALNDVWEIQRIDYFPTSTETEVCHKQKFASCKKQHNIAHSIWTHISDSLHCKLWWSLNVLLRTVLLFRITGGFTSLASSHPFVLRIDKCQRKPQINK